MGIFVTQAKGFLLATLDFHGAQLEKTDVSFFVIIGHMIREESSIYPVSNNDLEYLDLRFSCMES